MRNPLQNTDLEAPEAVLRVASPTLRRSHLLAAPGTLHELRSNSATRWREARLVEALERRNVDALLRNVASNLAAARVEREASFG